MKKLIVIVLLMLSFGFSQYGGYGSGPSKSWVTTQLGSYLPLGDFADSVGVKDGKNIFLDGSVNWTPERYDMLMLKLLAPAWPNGDTTWVEISRSDN